MTASRVLGDRASTASSTAPGPAIGNGIGATTTRQPRSAAAYSRMLRVALYSWSVTSSSPPGANGTERSTELIATVTFGTNARPFAGAPTNRASSTRAAESSTGASRLKKRAGSRSSWSRSACCAASTGRGHAPYEPWFR